MKENVLLGGAVAIILAAVFVASGRPINITTPPISVTSPDVTVNNPGGSSLGAVAVLTSPQDWNGVSMIHEKQNFRTGTSTVASYKVIATSTVAVSCFFGSGLTFAQEYEIAVGTTPNATSTFSLGKIFVPANGSVSGLSTSTTYVIEPVAPYINVKMATSSGTSVQSDLAPTGRCNFVGNVI